MQNISSDPKLTGTSIVDGVVGLKVEKLLRLGPDEHVAHEKSMVGTCADNADVYPVALIPASETVDNVDAIPRVEVIDGTLSVNAPNLDAYVSSRDLRMTVEMRGRLTSGLIGLLTGPHQMSSLEAGSSTIRLSLGERPVLAPE